MTRDREFERHFENGIPQHEAANFFLRIKKAGWTDAPDETGVLEGQFAADIGQVVNAVAAAAAAKFKLMVAYHIFAESMRGLAQHPIGEVFHEHAEMERAAAEAYLKRAAVLGGGPVHLPEIETPPACSDPIRIVMMLARAEQEAIALQTQLKQLVGETNPLSFQIEQFMIEDQHHLDELWQMLPQDMQHTPMLDEGAGGEVPAEGLPAEGAADPAAAAEPPVAPEEPSAEEAQPEEPAPAQKEAFARALSKIAGDLIKFPGKAERVVRGAGKALGDVLHSAKHLTPEAKSTIGAGGLGAVLGGLNSGIASSHRSASDNKKHLARGGPVTRLAVEHPVAYGATMGALSLGGGVAAAHALAHKPLGALGAVGVSALPSVAALAADRALKKKDKTAAARFQAALQKLGFSAPEPGLGTDPGAAPSPSDQQAVAPMPSMTQPGVQPMMANPPGQRQYAPVNYLEAEETGRRVQEQNEASFYRSKADEASTQVQSMGAQVQDIQGQLDQLSAQAAESQNQIMSANQEAVQANDQMLNQATLAARMRMGMQQLRAQMMEVASQDPEQLAAAAGGPTPMDVGMQAQQGAAGPAGAPAAGGDPSMGGAAPGDPNAAAGAPPGAPGASPDQGAPPGPPAGGEPKKPEGDSAPPKKEHGGETTVSIKKGSVKTADIYSETMGKLPFAAGGAAIGAGAGYLSARKGSAIPSLREKVDALKGQQDGGFSKAIELGKTQVALGEAEEARRSPMKSALTGGLLGAGLGVGLGAAVPAGIEGGKRLLGNLKTVASMR